MSFICDQCGAMIPSTIGEVHVCQGSFTIPACQGPTADEVTFLEAVRMIVLGSKLYPHQVAALLNSLAIEASFEAAGDPSIGVSMPVADTDWS